MRKEKPTPRTQPPSPRRRRAHGFGRGRRRLRPRRLRARRREETGRKSPSPNSRRDASSSPAETPNRTLPHPAAEKKGAPTRRFRPMRFPDTTIIRQKVRRFDMALELTTRNLDYKYGSADPATGGMDCSGFVYYVLTLKRVPMCRAIRASNMSGCGKPERSEP